MPTINYVWMGKGPLGPLEKFNIFSWRARGYDVAIYTFHFTRGRVFNHSNLGLNLGERERVIAHDRVSLPIKNPAERGITIHDVPTILGEDRFVTTDGDPRTKCPDMRNLMISLFATALDAENGVEANGLDPDARRDQIFNLVNLTKSYLGGTRRGLTMDFKIGPSPHLAAYEASFDTKFISFKRGSLIVGNAPENQCMGTNQGANTIRNKYATHFNDWIKDSVRTVGSAFKSVQEVQIGAGQGMLAKPRGKHYDGITTTHMKFFTQIRTKNDCLNVTEQAPDGRYIGSDYTFRGIGEGTTQEKAKGPFRVFKKAGDQTNQQNPSEKTSPSDVKRCAFYVLYNCEENFPNWDKLESVL
ncbi:MAG: hypothetical protein QM820_06855 [Minicystis sp.]